MFGDFFHTAHILAKHFGDGDRTVCILELFNDCGDKTRRCKTAAVERMNKARFARFAVAETGVEMVEYAAREIGPRLPGSKNEKKQLVSVCPERKIV